MLQLLTEYGMDLHTSVTVRISPLFCGIFYLLVVVT